MAVEIAVLAVAQNPRPQKDVDKLTVLAATVVKLQIRHLHDGVDPRQLRVQTLAEVAIATVRLNLRHV